MATTPSDLLAGLGNHLRRLSEERDQAIEEQNAARRELNEARTHAEKLVRDAFP